MLNNPPETLSPKAVPAHTFTFLTGGILAFAIALLVFIFLGSYGFNPTDEGIFLAPTRRIIEGQTPYIDFIWVRPLLTSVLYIPLVYFGGDYALLISRLIAYLQHLTIIWLSVWMFREEFAPHSSKLLYYFSIIIATTLTSALYVFYFVYNTLDGVLLSVIGLAFLQSKKISNKYFGYFLIGAACLAKQGFIITIPFCLLIFKDWRDWRMVTAALLPGISFVIFLILYGVFPEAWLQITALKGHYDRVYFIFLQPETIAGILIGCIASFAKNAKDTRKRYMIIAISILSLIWMMKMRAGGDLISYTLVPFGAVLSLLATRCYFDKIFMQKTAVLLVVSWASSISYTGAFPMWMSGTFGVAVLFAVISKGNDIKSEVTKSNLDIKKATIYKMLGKIKFEWIVGIIMSVFMAIFIELRLNKIPREKKFSLITTPLDGKFPGAAGIKTSASMAAVYEDLNEMVKIARSSGKRYAILPEMPSYWALAEDLNPLVIDSAYHVDLGNNNQDLVQRLVRNVVSLREDTVFIVQKFTAEHIYYDKPGVTYVKDTGESFSPNWFRYSFVIVGFIRDKFKLVSENDSFWMYQ